MRFIILFLIIAFATGRPGLAQEEMPLDGGPFDMVFTEIAPGVITGIRPYYWRTPVAGASTIIIGENEVLLFDSPGSREGVRQVVQKIRELTDKPLTFVLVSHGHDDHTRGLVALKEAYPAVKFVSHPLTREYIEDQVMARTARILERWPVFLATFKSDLESGIDSGSGEPLSEGARIDYSQTLHDADVIMADLAQSMPLSPDILIENSIVFDLGNRIVRFEHIGFGNTDSDLIAYLPGEKILLVGDIINHPIPFGFPFKPRQLVITLKVLLDYDFEILVPGHGDILYDRVFSDKVIELFIYVNWQVDEMVEQGMTYEQIQESFDWKDYAESFSGGDPVNEYLFDGWFQGPSLDRSFKERTALDEAKE